MTKTKSLEKEIHTIMMHYTFDPYGKQRYIENCSKAIVKVALEMVGEDIEPIENIEDPRWLNQEDPIINMAKDEIRQRIEGK